MERDEADIFGGPPKRSENTQPISAHHVPLLRLPDAWQNPRLPFVVTVSSNPHVDLLRICVSLEGVIQANDCVRRTEGNARQVGRRRKGTSGRAGDRPSEDAEHGGGGGTEKRKRRKEERKETRKKKEQVDLSYRYKL